MEELIKLDAWKVVIVVAPLMIVCLIGAWTDWKERKVFNKHTYPLIVIGLVTHTIAVGWPGLLDGALAVVIALFVGILLMVFFRVGGGDIKLLMGVGAALGLSGLLQVAWYSVWVGAALGLALALFNGYLWVMLGNVYRYLRGVFRMIIYKTKMVREELDVDDERNKVPFAIAILGGVILTLTDALYKWPGFYDWYLRGIGL